MIFISCRDWESVCYFKNISFKSQRRKSYNLAKTRINLSDLLSGHNNNFSRNGIEEKKTKEMPNRKGKLITLQDHLTKGMELLSANLRLCDFKHNRHVVSHCHPSLITLTECDSNSLSKRESNTAVLQGSLFQETLCLSSLNVWHDSQTVLFITIFWEMPP